MSILMRELVQACRQARRTPLITLAGTATLAIAIGATTFLYGLLYGIVHRPLPYPDPEALVQITSGREQGSLTGGFSLAEFRDWKDESRSYSGLALFSSDQFSVVLPGAPARPLHGAVVSDGFFELFGAPMRLGRGLTAADAASPSVVISERLWRTWLGADPGVLNRTLLIAGDPYTIVGVADGTLALPEERTDLFMPVEFRRLTAPPAWGMRGFRAFSLVGRLDSGVSLAGARDEADRIVAAWQERYPRFSAGLRATVTGLREQLYGDAQAGLRLLLTTVAIVLVIAALNVAGLLIARDTGRQYEIAVRRALGATPGHLWRQSLIESALMAVVGTVSGVGLSVMAVRALQVRPPAGLPRVEAVGIDGPVLAVTAGIAVAVTLLLGTVLARRSARMAPAAVLQYGRTRQGGRHQLRQALAVGQVVMTFAVLVVALVLTSGLRQLVGAATGLREGRMVALSVAGADRSLLDRVLPKLAALPGVEAAGVTSSLPPHVSQMQTTVRPLPGSASSEPVPVDIVAVSPGTLDALGLKLLEGRFFSGADLTGGARSLVISARAASQLFPHVSPVGRNLPFGPSAPGQPPPVVVGVVDDVRYRGLDAAPEGAIYMPYTQRTFDAMHLVVRSRMDGLQVASEVRKVVAAEAPYQAVAEPRSLAALVGEASSAPRLRLRIVAALSALALLLSALGVYGVLAETVASRRQEFAVRSALGARPSHLRMQVITYGMRLIVVGLALGVVPAYLLSRALPHVLGGVVAAGPGIYALAALLLVLVGLSATWWPALRAGTSSPAQALQAN